MNAIKTQPDPLYGLREAFLKCTNEQKVDLTLGVYGTPNVHIFNAVEEAEQQLQDDPNYDHGYLAMGGSDEFVLNSRNLIFNQPNPSGVAGIQTVSGTGACSVAAQFLRQLGVHTVHISNPSWVNHRSIFEHNGMDVREYRYINDQVMVTGLDIEGLLEDLGMAKGAVLFQVCGHNPTGVDPTHEQWSKILAMIKENTKIDVLLMDLAYQGFASGDMYQDSKPVRMARDLGITTIIAHTFSKNLGLYGERIGSLHVTCCKNQTDEVNAALAQIARYNYSNPPKHGSYIVNKIFSDLALYREWILEFRDIYNVIKHKRELFHRSIRKKIPERNWDFVLKQKGMFVYSGLSKAQAVQLRVQFHIYILDSGRINIANLPLDRMDYVVDSIAHVLRA